MREVGREGEMPEDTKGAITCYKSREIYRWAYYRRHL